MPDRDARSSERSLPLSPFERMMVADDDADYPMVAIVELTFRGSVQRALLERAITVALERNPLLRSRIEKSVWGRSRWVPTRPGPFHFVESAENPPVGSHLDLRREPGMRLALAGDESQSRLIVEVHHACCDGIGVFQFLEDILVGYANECSPGDDRVVMRSLDPDRLRRRNHFGWNSVSFGQWLYHLYFGLRIVLQFSANPPKALGIARRLGEPTHPDTCGLRNLSPIRRRVAGEAANGRRATTSYAQ